MNYESKEDSAYAAAFPTTPITTPITTTTTTTEKARKELASKRLIFMVDGTRSMGHVVAQVRNLAIEVGAIGCMVGISIYYCIYTDYHHLEGNRQIGGKLVEGQKYVVLVIDGNRSFTDVEGDLNKYYKADIMRNGDNDEAQKTALQYLLQNEYLTGPENTLIVHMTDSLPHEDDIDICIAREGSGDKTKSNGYHEINALNSKEWSHWWVPICEAVKSQATVLTSYEVPEYARESNSNADNKYRETYKMLGFVVSRYLTTEEMSKIILHAFGLAESSEVIELPQLASLTLKIIQRIVPLSKMISTLEYIILKNPMLLILNPILGFIWRFVCKHRKDPIYEDKITILCNSLSGHTGSLSRLGREDKEKLKKFIQDSYSNKDAIVEILQPFCLSGPQRFFVINGDSFISQDNLLAITRGAPKSACRAAANLLREIESCVGTLIPTQQDCSFLPIGLFEELPSTAFKLLPHLLFPGIEFNKRGAKIMAILALKNALLREYAEDFLLSCIRNQGYLFDFSKNDTGKPNVPENWSVGFFLNILTEARDLLDSRTDILLRIDILIVQKIKRNALASVICHIGKRPTPSWKKELVPDHKRQCRLCHQWRSETTFCEEMCGLCTCRKQKFGQQYDCMIIAEEFPDKDEKQSYMTECNNCAKMYAVCNTKVLTQKPKCFYCRDGVETPPENINTCTHCRKQFCAPLGSTDGYVCASCKDTGEPRVQEYDTSVQDIFGHNNVLGCTPLLFDNILNKSLKDYLRSLEFLDLECLLPTLGPHLLDGYEESGGNGESGASGNGESKRQSKRQSKHDSMSPLSANGGMYEILDPSETIRKLLEALKGTGKGTCSISYEEVPLDQLLCCGNPRCNYLMSIDSWKSIFEPVQPGHPVHTTNLCCPFCRRKPYYQVVKKAAKHLCAVNGLRGFLDSGLNETHWSGLCTECNQIKAMAPRGGDCNAPMPATTNFKCSDCTHSTRSYMLLAAATDGNDGDQKPCPSCGIMIVKDDDGEKRCWHVECSCGIHFCWKDGKCFDSGEACYEYMWATHDSIGY